MVGEVRIVKAEFLQENNISMAKDSTNPLNIEWFSYENYDLDFASCGHSAQASQKRAHICILLSQLRGQLKARKNF